MSSAADEPVAANVLGTIGTVCWCVQLIPQIWVNWRRKNTDGVPGLMMLLWGICAVPFGTYAVIQDLNIAIQVQPQIFGVLCLTCWVQTLIYTNRWSVTKATTVGLVVGTVEGGIEALLVLTLRGPDARGIHWPVLLVGIIGAILLIVGCIPPYFELGKRDGRVIGISFVFLSIDCAGAIFSLCSLVAQNTFDILAGTQYSLLAVLEIGIFLSHAIWRIRTWREHQEARRAGLKYDDFVKADLSDHETEESPAMTEAATTEKIV